MNSRKMPMSIALVAFLMLSVTFIGAASACTTTNSNPNPIQYPSLNYCSCVRGAVIGIRLAANEAVIRIKVAANS